MTIAGKERTLETRRIGSLEVSVAGLGCNNFGWRIDYDATAAVVDAALDAGIDFFDTAEAYPIHGRAGADPDRQCLRWRP